MKKILFLFIVIILIYIFLGNVVISQDIIPDDAIRIRVIANSNSGYDQQVKYKVKETLESDMNEILKDTTKIEEARVLINKNLSRVKEHIDKTLQQENYKLPFSVNFGLNYFPSKEFKGIEYKEGYYESLVVTLGEGLGDNWWCVLFPPLCALEAEESTDVEYTTMAKIIIDKYF